MRLSTIAEFEAAATCIAAKITGNFEAADKAKLERVVSDTISWFDRSCASGQRKKRNGRRRCPPSFTPISGPRRRVSSSPSRLGGKRRGKRVQPTAPRRG